MTLQSPSENSKAFKVNAVEIGEHFAVIHGVTYDEQVVTFPVDVHAALTIRPGLWYEFDGLALGLKAA